MIGELSNRIEILKQSEITNENGFVTKSYELVRKVWASARNLTSKEFYEAERINKEKTVVFKTRYINGIDESLFIRFQETIFGVESVNDIKYKRKYLEIKAIQVNASE